MKPLSRNLLAGACLALLLIAAPTSAAAQTSARPGQTYEELQSLTVSISFTEANLDSATRFLNSESKRLDPGHRAINFILAPGAADSAKPVTLSLENVPMAVALRYICQLANVKYKIQDYGVTLLPMNAPSDDLVTRTFSVPPNFLDSANKIPPPAAP